jgi:RPA family protein
VGILLSKKKPLQRHIAYKRSISDIINSDYIKGQGFEPNFLVSKGVEVFRMNLIGVVVDKIASGNQHSFVLDDGTGSISIRFFGENNPLEKISITDVVMVIGRPREFSSERYLLLESIAKLDPAWAKVRKLELKKYKQIKDDNSKKNGIVDQTTIEKPPKFFHDNNRNKVLKAIKDFDKGEGTLIDDLPGNIVPNIEITIETLLKQGEIFEVKPGKLKVLE